MLLQKQKPFNEDIDREKSKVTEVNSYHKNQQQNSADSQGS